jgi:hypothetical protein
LSGPTIVFGAVVVVPLCSSCAVAAVVVVVGGGVVVVAVLDGVVVPLCPDVVVFAAGAELVVELPFFFAFAFAVGVVCAVAIEPAARNALTQKLAANFRYRFIADLSRNFFSTTSSTPTPARRVDTTSASPKARVAALHML